MEVMEDHFSVYSTVVLGLHVHLQGKLCSLPWPLRRGLGRFSYVFVVEHLVARTSRMRGLVWADGFVKDPGFF